MNPNVIPYKIVASSCGNSLVSLSSFVFAGSPGSGALWYESEGNLPAPIFGKIYVSLTPFKSLASVGFNPYFNYIYTAPMQSQSYPPFPYTGWTSVNPVDNPPPTFTATEYLPVSSILVPCGYEGYDYVCAPYSDSDSFLTDTSIQAYTSSVNISKIKQLQVGEVAAIKSLDLSLFSSLCGLRILRVNSLSALNLKRNINLKDLTFQLYSVGNDYKTNIAQQVLGNNLLGKNFNSINFGLQYLFYIPKHTFANSITVRLSGTTENYFLTGVNANFLTVDDLASDITDTLILSGTSINNATFTCDVIKNLSAINNFSLSQLTINSTNLSSFSTLNSNITSITLNTPSLSSFAIPDSLITFSSNNAYIPYITIDSILDKIDYNTTNVVNYKTIDKPSKVLNYTASRSPASDDSFISLLRKDYYLSPLGKEFNSKYYVPSKPAGYIPSTNLSNNIMLMNPISARNGLPQSLALNQYDYYTVRFNQLSGIYAKTVEVYNNRDVWRNPNNYFILFNESLSGWTVVGPLSTSTSIWLSAAENKTFFGDPPSMGWYGPAYTDGGFRGGTSYTPATYGTVYSQSTNATSTQLYMLSSFNLGVEYSGQGYLAQGQYSYQGNPGGGLNQDFYWKDYNFLSKMVLGNFNNPFSSGKGYLLSPIHFTYNFHFPPGWSNFTHPNNSTVRLYSSDGSYITRTALSGKVVAGDLCVGILNTPVTSPYTNVHLATSYYCGGITSIEALTSFVLGPLQSSKFGIIPFNFATNSTDFCSLALAAPLYYPPYQSSPWGYYDNVYSFNKGLLVSETIAGKDSGCAMWVLSGKNTILLGQLYTPTGGPSAYGSGPVNAITQAMTALSQAYSKPTYYPSLAIFDT